jgi:prepilin-type processing-associated H-X9-DG protein
LVPIYLCPSRGVRKILRTGKWEGETILMDYAGVQPCTYIKDNPQLVDITPGKFNSDMARTVFNQDEGHSGSDGQALPWDTCTYDGVIVRSPWAGHVDHGTRAGSTSVISPGSRFLDGVPQPTEMSKISDGTSNTLLIAEKWVSTQTYDIGTPSDDTGWTDGWDADIMRVSGVPPLNDGSLSDFTQKPPDFGPPWYVLAMGSPHPGGFNAVFADGSVHTISYDVDVFVLNALGTRNGEETNTTSSAVQ